jgi:outer membrane lipopolysaccharide assembly protein LptE/RlpB
MRPAARAMAVTALAAVLSALGGCGFALQGATPLPAAVSLVRVDTADPRTAFAGALERRLRGAGATLAGPALVGSAQAAATDPQGRAVAVLRIERDELLERVASLSARNVPREYEYTYIVRWSFERDGVRSIETAEISASRNLTFDERRVLAKQREREQLRDALAEELAGVVLQRISGLR